MSSAPEESSRSELHPAVRIGHVHLRVADLDRAMSFYRDVLGFELTAYGADFGLEPIPHIPMSSATWQPMLSLSLE